MSQIHDVIRELERVIEMLRGSRCGGEWADQMEQRLIGLRSVDSSVQRQTIVALRGICHHRALGDALTDDEHSYILQVAKLREACDRAIAGYDEAVA